MAWSSAAPVRSAPVRWAPARLAPVRSRRLKLAPDRSQPGHSLTRPARKSSRWPACAHPEGYAVTAAAARRATAERRGYDISFIYLLTLLVPHRNLPYLASLLGIKIATNDVWSRSLRHVHVQTARTPVQSGFPRRPCCARTCNGRDPASLRTGPGAKAARIHARAGGTRQVDLSEELPGLSRLDARPRRSRRRPPQGHLPPAAFGLGGRPRRCLVVLTLGS